MGISSVAVHWLESLWSRGVFAGKDTILDLGPQDLVVSKPVLSNFIKAVDPLRSVTDFYDGDALKPMAMKPFYAAMGLSDYASLDLDDPRSEYRIDLNRPTPLNRSFDVITDFGTIEHIFNPCAAVEFIHDHLPVGGVCLHILPTRGDYGHGFYNIHSTWFRDIAAANNYDTLDLLMVNDFGQQHDLVTNQERDGDTSRLSRFIDIKGTDEIDGDERFALTAAWRHLKRRWIDKRINGRIYDYIFCAVRKTSDAPFVIPQQAYYQKMKAV